MNEAAPETYILPVPGTEETQELPRGVVLEKIARGELTPTDWVWSPADQDWKPIAEIPSLQPTVARPKKSFLTPLAPPATPQKIEPVLAPAASAPSKKKKVVKPRRESEDREESSLLGPIACALILAVFGVIGANYQLVDRPMDGALAHTPFVLVPAHAHLGAFFQTDKLVIHVIPNSELSADNFADFLYALAGSTPPPPFVSKAYTVVEVTPGWRGRYAFTGEDWQKLGQLASSSPEGRKAFILDHIDDPTGRPLLTDHAGSDERDSAWQNLAAAFHAEGGPGFSLAGALQLVSSLTSKASTLVPSGSTNSNSGTPPGSSPAAPHAPAP